MGKPDNIIPFDRRKVLESTDKPLGELDDDELMLLARGGCGEAFDTLVRRHQGRVLRVAGRILGQSALAKDAAQKAFFSVYRSLESYQARGRFRSFMYRVLLNQCLMEKRSAKRQELIRDRVAAAEAVNSNMTEKKILARERRLELERALGRLSRKLREVLVLRFVADLSYAEISEVLKVPVGTVKSRMFSGLERLRRIMGGQRL